MAHAEHIQEVVLRLSWAEAEAVAEVLNDFTDKAEKGPTRNLAIDAYNALHDVLDL
jgi:hypothetical protein